MGEKISGCSVEDFDIEKYQQEYKDAGEENKNETFLGRFVLAALGQKSVVTNKIFSSGNMLAGFSVDITKKGFGGIKDFRALIEANIRSNVDD